MSSNANDSTAVQVIAIPVANGRLCLHFGHCEQFAVLDVNTEERVIVHSRHLAPPPHEPGLLPRWLHEQGVKLVIAGGMGARAQDIFAQQGIDVIVGAPSESPEDLVRSYLEGTLVGGKNLCDH